MNYYHYTKKKLSLQDIKDVPQKEPESSVAFKPSGLWISVEDDWKEWNQASEFLDLDTYYCYQVEIIPGNILWLNSAWSILEFISKYKQANGKYEYIQHIDWMKVAVDYQGVIMTDYDRSLYWNTSLFGNSLWYSVWDCRSGCIWNKEAVSDIILHSSPRKYQ